MTAIREKQKICGLARVEQAVLQRERILDVDELVARALSHHQASFEKYRALVFERHRSIPSISVGDRIVEIALGKNRVVEMPVHDRSARESCLIRNRAVEHGVNRKETSITPSANAEPCRVDVGQGTEIKHTVALVCHLLSAQA